MRKFLVTVAFLFPEIVEAQRPTAEQVLAEDARSFTQGPFRFLSGSVAIDRSGRIAIATKHFLIESHAERPVKFVAVVCEFHKADGGLANGNDSWAHGGVGYIRPGEVVSGIVSLPAASEAVSAKCGIDDRYSIYD